MDPLWTDLIKHFGVFGLLFFGLLIILWRLLKWAKSFIEKLWSDAGKAWVLCQVEFTRKSMATLDTIAEAQNRCAEIQVKVLEELKRLQPKEK